VEIRGIREVERLGRCDQGDAASDGDVFLEPPPFCMPIALGAATVLNASWTKQADIPPSLYRLRVVVITNGQSARASTGDIRVLNLVDSFDPPIA
jgi:hypothetical protein